MLKEFKTFISRGNVIDLAVGVIIGAAFGKIIASLVNDILMPIIGLILGRVNFSELKIVIKPAVDKVPEVAIRYGAFIQSILDFVIIAFCIFLFVRAYNKMKAKEEAEKVEEAPKEPVLTLDQQLLGEIKDLLSKRN